jgi:RHS repeat-associated protein
MAGHGVRGLSCKWVFHLLILLTCSALHAQSQGTVTYVYTDPQGTPLAEADANGNITATFDYTPYGTYAPQGTSTPGPTPNGPGYTGHVNDPETNLVYMQARYYDPATGHFLSVDPTTPSAGGTSAFNRYAYASNNPIGNVDPNGKQTIPLANELGTDDPALINRVQVAQLNNADKLLDAGRQLTEPLVAEAPELGAVPSMISAVADFTFAASKTTTLLGAAASDVPAAERVQGLTSLLDPIAQSKRTVAVLDTTQGTRVLASGGRDLNPAQRATQQAGEQLANQPGAHAEVTALNHAANNGLTPSSITTSRPICSSCQNAIQQSGGTVTSPTTAQWPKQ